MSKHQNIQIPKCQFISARCWFDGLANLLCGTTRGDTGDVRKVDKTGKT